ncbi:MAG: TetR family transcriptional regulator C-terminal domain-containing protein [Roseobacter sp.]
MTAQQAQSKRAQLQHTIRLAALEEFASNGLHGASMQAIANRAQIAKPKLYYYITSKEELYKDILESIVTKWGTLAFDIQNGDDPVAAISYYIDIKIRHALENPLECRFFSQEVARGAPVLQEHWEQSKQAVQRANAVIQSWVDAGKINPVNPTVFQMQLWAVTQHYADYEAQAKFFLDVEPCAALDPEILIKEAQTLFLSSIRTTTG